MKNLLVAVFVAAFFVAKPAVAQPVDSPAVVTFDLSATNNNGDRDPATPGLQVDEGDRVTLTMFVDGTEAIDTLGGHRLVLTTSDWGGTAEVFDYWRVGETWFGGSSTNEQYWWFIDIIDDSAAEPDETLIMSMPGVELECSDDDGPPAPNKPFYECNVAVVYSNPVTITIRQNDGYVAPVATPDPVADNSTARAENPLNAPTAAIARGIGILAADAVTKRLRTTATANQLNIGRANTAEELLRRSDFNLAGGRGFNFWGGGSYVSTDGEHDGVDYDGDTSAFTLGIDTGWRDGLIGVAVSRSDSDVDMTLTAPVPPIGRIVDIKGKLETEVTSVHPYLTRRFGKSQLWLTAGYGNGNAEVKEQYARIKTDITVTTVALGLRRAHGQLTGNISALYTRAELDDVTDGRTYLLGTTVDSLRITADGKARWVHGAFSPFVDFTVRHDSGDGDTGIAGDLGGGIEYRAPTVVVRLTAAATIAAESAEENRASFTVRKSAGDFDLSLNLGLNNAGIETARLLHGKWRL